MLSSTEEPTPVDAAGVKTRLQAADFVLREAARDSIAERWGDTWQSWLIATAQRLAVSAKLTYHEDSGKWLVADRQDRLVLSADGRVVVAAFPGSAEPAEVAQRFQNGEFGLSATTEAIVTEKFGETGVEKARLRITEMAFSGTMTWRLDSPTGGWRLAADGDVVLIDSRGLSVQKMFWHAMDDRAAASIEDVQQALATFDNQSGLRVARRLVWKLERAFGPNWLPSMQLAASELAESGQIAPHGDNGYAAINGNISLLISRDAQVIVSARIATTGDAEAIRSSVIENTISVNADLAEDNSRYSRPNEEVMKHFAAKLATVSTPEATSTHWAIRFEGIEVSLGTDGAAVTGLMTRPTDEPDVVAKRMRAGLCMARPAALRAAKIEEITWFDQADASQLERTPKGFRWTYEGKTAIVDSSGTMIVAFDLNG